MNKYRITHINNDPNLGGVNNGLKFFNSPPISDHFDSKVVHIKNNHFIASEMNSDIIILHHALNWKSMPFIYSLKKRNPHAFLVWNDHHYIGDWEKYHVKNQSRFRMMVKICCALVDHIICVSDAQARWYISFAPQFKHKISVINPCTSKNELLQLPPPDFAIGKPLIIGALGRFCFAKGFDTMIKAFNMLPSHCSHQLLIGGFGPDEQQYRKYAGNNPKIIFDGRVDDVASFMARCDVMLIPSRYETFGSVATESMMAARPIITSYGGGLPDQVGNGGVSIDCTDPQIMADMLANISSLPLHNMAMAGREQVRHSYRERVGQWLNFCSEVTGLNVDADKNNQNGLMHIMAA
ncbi:hypothetical protein LPB140_01165 [Sphingorhabdus lutea]|uniref:Glycosyl transferase family 1 domain-containing protein n=1 Tax=Sphingorhabdus lutea TaxID=1913578 RepID=A0A1L3J9A0_9SPHN|nr:glycosyltransferase family 4 protein [Sphingorhabdus lutea]APG61673.1 hypothetical protein LPB140_01165 [Sphingorhabdus lutea]